MGYKRGMQRLIDKEWKKGLVIFAGLVLFHITFSILLSIIARSAVLSSLHNGQGLWNFALDSFVYHQEALRLVDLLKKGDRKGKTVTLKVKYFDFQQITRSITVSEPVVDATVIMNYVQELLANTDAGKKKVRLLGISISNFAGCLLFFALS